MELFAFILTRKLLREIQLRSYNSDVHLVVTDNKGEYWPSFTKENNVAFWEYLTTMSN